MTDRLPNAADGDGAQVGPATADSGPPPDRSRLPVLHLGPDSEGAGGMAAVIAALLASPLATDHRLEAVATYRTPHPVRRVALFLRALASLVRWCARPGPRLVHVHTTVRGSMYRKAVYVAAAKALRRPVVLHVHAGGAEIEAFDRRLGPVRRGILRSGLGLADRVVSVSSAGAREVERRFGLASVLVVPNAAPAVDAARVASGARKLDRGQVLYLGGFANPVKGGDVLLAALPAVMAASPHASVLLAGPGEPPASARPLLEERRSVRWLGWLDDARKADALATSSVFVLPSLSEGLPMALLEAMANGMAVVATDMGGVPDVVSDGVDGILVPPGDPERLAEALVELLNSPVRRDDLGRRARARAERLNAGEVYAALATVYADLAGR